MGKAISLREHQLIMLDILKCFAEYCDNNNLRYYLDAGTLLGAVRNKGFIPWDNDVDVCMPREDYDRFIKLLSKNNNKLADNIVLEKPEDTMYHFLKIGDIRTELIEYPNKMPMSSYVYIDVFPKDRLLDDGRGSKRICKISEKLALWYCFTKYLMFAWRKDKNIIKRVAAFLGRILFKNNKNWPIRKQNIVLDKYRSKVEKKNCLYLTTLINGEFSKRTNIHNFDEYVFLQFEGIEFKCPKGYMDYLKDLYGPDFMTPPPLGKEGVHEVLVYWR